jgi:solute carrier family 35 protein E1
MRGISFVAVLLVATLVCSQAFVSTSISTLVASKQKRKLFPSIKRNENLPANNAKQMSLLSAAGGGKFNERKAAGSTGITKYLQLTGLFALWYAFNAGYNVYNAEMKQRFKFPLAAATIQLIIGVIFRAIPMWGLKLREVPKLTWEDLGRLLPIAILNAMGHAFTVVAMFQKGGGSFTHVIKASEPVVSVFLAFLVNRIVPKPLTALSLLPITYGVAYASTLGNLNIATMSREFTSMAAIMAMASNFAFAMRSILRKNLPKDFQQRTKLDPVNEFAITTLLSFLMLVPFVLRYENIGSIVSSLQTMGTKDRNDFFITTLLCGGCFYLYNELQNIVLGSLGAVPTAVGNTLKRVAIFVALYFFTPGEIFPWPKIVGCGIAIAGCLLFAIFDSLKV